MIPAEKNYSWGLTQVIQHHGWNFCICDGEATNMQVIF